LGFKCGIYKTGRCQDSLGVLPNFTWVLFLAIRSSS
jgi:hypothetical protein